MADKKKAKTDEAYGYDYEPEAFGGKYLGLKQDGDEIVIRLVSSPKHATQHWTTNEKGKKQPVLCTDDDSCPYCGADVPTDEKIDKSKVFVWVVLDRNDENKVKVYTQSGVSVYKKIKGLALDAEWGDPTAYDIRVTRTGEKGADFYRVTPLRNADPLTDEEKKAIEEANYDLDAELKGEGKDTSTFGSSAGAGELDDDDSMETVADDKSDDEDVDVNDEKIPF